MRIIQWVTRIPARLQLVMGGRGLPGLLNGRVEVFEQSRGRPSRSRPRLVALRSADVPIINPRLIQILEC